MLGLLAGNHAGILFGKRCRLLLSCQLLCVNCLTEQGLAPIISRNGAQGNIGRCEPQCSCICVRGSFVFLALLPRSQSRSVWKTTPGGWISALGFEVDSDASPGLYWNTYIIVVYSWPPKQPVVLLYIMHIPSNPGMYPRLVFQYWAGREG